MDRDTPEETIDAKRQRLASVPKAVWLENDPLIEL